MRKAKLSLFFVNILRLISLEAPQHLSAEAVLEGGDLFEVDRLLGECLRGDSDAPIFLLAPFGAGKTSHLIAFAKKHRGEWSIVRRSMFSVGRLNEAYLHLLPILDRVLAAAVYFGFVLLISFFNGWAILRSSPIALTFAVVTSLFLLNKMRFYYLLGACVGSVLSWGYERVVIVDDLDRSSMPQSDWWALLANLWTFKTRYIVALGYRFEGERLALIEIAAKLGGQVIELPLNGRVTGKILSRLDKNFPFEENTRTKTWLSNVTPRELIAISDRVRLTLNPESSVAKQKAYYMHFCFSELKRKFVSPEKQWGISGGLNGPAGDVTINSSIQLDGNASQILVSFRTTFKPGLVQEITDAYAQSNGPKHNPQQLIAHVMLGDQDVFTTPGW